MENLIKLIIAIVILWAILSYSLNFLGIKIKGKRKNEFNALYALFLLPFRMAKVVGRIILCSKKILIVHSASVLFQQKLILGVNAVITE